MSELSELDDASTFQSSLPCTPVVMLSDASGYEASLPPMGTIKRLKLTQHDDSVSDASEYFFLGINSHLFSQNVHTADGHKVLF